MKRKPLILFLFCWLTISLSAQHNTVFTGCASDLMQGRHPEFKAFQKSHDQNIYKAALQPGGLSQSDQATHTLPVVVHIVHNGGPENIPDAQVQQCMAHLNAAFEASFGTGVNTGVQFCLAQRDPNGLATNGITRDQSALTNVVLENEDLALKNLNRWAPTCFINIWVVSEISSLSSGSGVAGYAYLPSAHGSSVDGIVVEADYFGSSPFNSSVLVHEMGHYLGLYHTFQNGCANNNCMLDGDQVCDTPPDQTTFSSCNPNANSCGTDTDDISANNPFTTDVADLGEDYMDYSSLQCFSKFTQGQSDRMNWFITNVRGSLKNCLSCQTPCPAPLTATITSPAAAQTVVIGSTLNFSATASNTLNFAWNTNNDPVFSTALNAAYTFNSVGTFWVKFRAITGNPDQCFDALDSVKVIVTCDAQAIFSVPPVIQAGISNTFVNNSLNANSYEWILDNVPVSNAANLNYIFTNSGVYQLCLRAANDNCSSTLCATIYVEQDSAASAGCDNTFIESLAGMGGTRPNIFPHPNGDFFATGLRNDSIVIVRFDQGGASQWARAFRLGPDLNQILDMYVDVSGDLIGIASPEAVSVSDLRTTAFRYNLTSNSFVWIKRFTKTRYTQIHVLDANSCVMTGESNSGSTQLVRINKNTGAVNGYDLEGEDGDFYSNVYNGTIYGACRRYFSASGDFRASVFAHDLNTGAFQWQNSIISRGNTSGSNETRMYPEKPIIDNNNLLVLAAGDLDGFGGYFWGSSELVLAKTTLTGDVIWTRQYVIAGHDAPAAMAVVSTASGYYIVSNLFNINTNNFDYAALIKTDKQGIVQWARRMGISGKNIARNVMERNGYIYLTMSSDSYALNDLLLLKLDQNGNTNSDCDFLQPINVQTLTLQNIQDQRNYATGAFSSAPATLNALAAPTAHNSIIYCNTPCVCPELSISAGPDTSICKGEPVALQSSPGFDGYSWSPVAGLNNPNIQNPIATPVSTTTYVLDAIKYGVELVANGDFALGNTAFTSNYINGGIGFGTYNVTNNPLLFNNQWHIPQDHTPTPDNMMLMTDGDDSGTFPVLWKQSVLVEPNKDYIFKFWGAMAYYANAPTIEVKINGVVQSNFTLLDGNNQVGIWQPFSLMVNSGAASQFLIELTDRSTSSIGNDFALDDISLRSVCHYTDSLVISVKGGTAPTLDLGPNITACSNATHTFDAGAGFESYQWQDGSTGSTFTSFSAGTYWVTVRDSCGGIQQDTVVVTLAPTPTLDLGPDQSICAGAVVQLTYTSNGVFTSFNWSPAATLNCTTCPVVLATPSVSTVYFLVGTTADGCTNLDSVTVTVKQPATYTQNITQCGNLPFTYNGHVYTQNGTYLDTLTTAGGCDSLVTTVLSFVDLPTLSETISFCLGGSVTIDGVTYTQSTTVTDTLAGSGGCDTIVTYQLIALPFQERNETVVFCPGESIEIAGNVYTIPGIVVDTLISNSLGCDTIVTYTLQYQPDVASVVDITCPHNINVAVPTGGAPVIVNYDLPTTSSDCPCPGIALTLTAGLPSGELFPAGLTSVCYSAEDSCGNSASCCFNIFIREEQACDIKEIGCMKYELLNITADPGQNYTYRIRVTNNCTSQMQYTAIQLPNGVTAMEPLDLSVFDAESGRQYDVRNPNASPFHSIRFKTIGNGISAGESEIFRYTLPAQSVPVYIHVGTRLMNQAYYESHLNTFYCPIGITPDGDKPADRNELTMPRQADIRVFPNPSADDLYIDLSEYAGKALSIRLMNVFGQSIRSIETIAPESPFLLQMPETAQNGLYLLEFDIAGQAKSTLRFILQRP